MQIFGICVTKNEDDILEYVLTRALEWCDTIYVVNNSERDKTTAIVNKLERQTGRVKLVTEFPGEFYNGLRSIPFNNYNHLAHCGDDWWCRLDSDEVYLDNPRKFLGAIPRIFHSVYSASCQYYFTDIDLKQYEKDPELYEGSRSLSNLHYFDCNHSELRFFRYRGQHWPAESGWPEQSSLFPIYPGRIRLAHYQYRSPVQIQQRLNSRLQVRAKNAFRHEKRLNKNDSQSLHEHKIDGGEWKQRVAKSRKLYDDRLVPVTSVPLKTLAYFPSVPRQILDITRAHLRWKIKKFVPKRI